MAIRIQSKFIYNGVEYLITIDGESIATDTEAQENSARPITSGAIYELILGLSEFIGRRVVSEISPNGADSSIPTASAVSDKLKNVVYYDISQGKLYYRNDLYAKVYIS